MSEAAPVMVRMLRLVDTGARYLARGDVVAATPAEAALWHRLRWAAPAVPLVEQARAMAQKMSRQKTQPKRTP